MSIFVNDRDVLLDEAPVRVVDPRAGRVLLLTIDPPVFHVNASGTVAPATAKVIARLIGLKGAATFSMIGGVLTGTADNARFVAGSSMAGETAQVTATIVYQGETYTDTQTISRVLDGAAGDAATLTPEAILTSLENRITKSQLFADLKAEINLITDPVGVPGSVQARVKAETDARVAALGQEVQDRMAADLAEAGARAAYVQNYTYSKLETNSALSIQASAIVAAYTAYADQKKAEAISVAAADIRNYSYSKATADAAESAQSAALTTSYTAYADAARVAATSAASADVRNYAYSKSTTDSAIASAESRLRSEFVGSGGATEAYVTSYAYSKSQIDQSEALQSSTLTANFQAAANAARDQAVSTASADVRNYSYAKSAIDSAFSSQSSAITAAYTSYTDAAKGQAISAAAADVRSYSYAKATVDNAISSSVGQVSARLDNIGGSTLEQRFTAQASLNSGLSTQYTIKSDINNYITGFGFASSANNGAPTSSFIINAAAFAVVAPGVAPKVMFSVGDGTVGFSGELKGPSGTLGSLKLLEGKGLVGGSFATKAAGAEWPAAGAGPGFQIGDGAIRTGSTADNRFVFFGFDGNLITPQFSVINGNATFSGNISAASGTFAGTLTASNVITTDNLQNNSTKGVDVFSTMSSFAGGPESIFNMPVNGEILILANIGVDGGSGTQGYQVQRWNGSSWSAVANYTQTGTSTNFLVAGAAAGDYRLMSFGFYGVVTNVSVIKFKK